MSVSVYYSVCIIFVALHMACYQQTKHIFINLLIVQVLELSDNIRKQIPDDIDYEQTTKIMISDTSPLKTVLLQEVGVPSTHSLLYGCFAVLWLAARDAASYRQPLFSDIVSVAVCISGSTDCLSTVRSTAWWW